MTGILAAISRRHLARRRQMLSLAAGGLVLPAFGAPALAHHGWSWADGELMTLDGAITEISMAPPHPVLMVRAADGVVWQVDLGNPNQTARSGFTGTTAKAGDPIKAIGNRNQDQSKMHMKAIRIVLAGRNYDLYPERIPANLGG